MFAAFKKRRGRIGYIKPIGQRFVEVEGKQIDEDAMLMEDSFKVHVPLEDMSPIAVEPDFTRKYIEHANNDHLVTRLQRSFEPGGVGERLRYHRRHGSRRGRQRVRPVQRPGGAPAGQQGDHRHRRRHRQTHRRDRAQQGALRPRGGVEIVGVILNKVLPDKHGYIENFARRGLDRLGIDLLGTIPDVRMLAAPELTQICETIGGEFLHAPGDVRRRVGHIVIGAMSSGHVVEEFRPGTLVITPGDREDIILAGLSSHASEKDESMIAGVVLSGNLRPHKSVLALIKTSDVPVIMSPLDSFTVASKIHSMTVKTLPGDTEKIGKIQSLIEQYVEGGPVVAEVARGSAAPAAPNNGSRRRRVGTHCLEITSGSPTPLGKSRLPNSMLR